MKVATKPLEWIARGVLVLAASILAGCAAQAAAYPQPALTVGPHDAYVEPLPERGAPEPGSSTPDLIERAYALGQIDDGQRWLYLAYAVFEYESLPAEFQSNVPWRGTLLVRDLTRAVNSPETLCALDPGVQAELRRLIPTSVACPP